MRDKEIAIIAKGSGISFSFEAVNTKCYYMAKILKSYGLNVTILSSIYYQRESVTGEVGRYHGIKYYMPSVYPNPNSKWKRSYYKFVYIWKVICFLIHLKRKWAKVHFVFDDNSTPFPILLILQGIGVVELIFNLEEWPLSHNIPLKRKMLSHWFVAFAFKTCRKSVCVSSYLIRQAIHYNKQTMAFKLPALTQFSESRSETSVRSTDQSLSTRFLYCGNVGYSEVILAILKAYEDVCFVRTHDEVELVLILHGDALQLQGFSDYVRQSKYAIKMITGLSEPDLFAEYAQASVLLAPLRLTVQDEARFPQKIAEYVALSKPIITTSVGDICLYFESDESAIFLDDFSVAELTRKMDFVIENKQKLTAIGIEGNLVGRRHFDYKQYIVSFGDFVTS